MGFPSCDNVGIPPNNYSYTDTGRFEESCEHKYQFLDGPWYGNVQNPCNCSTYLSCGSTQLSECAVGQIFNPCLQACTAYILVKKVLIFVVASMEQIGNQEKPKTAMTNFQQLLPQPP